MAHCHAKVAVVAPGSTSTLIMKVVAPKGSAQNFAALPRLLVGVTVQFRARGVVARVWVTVVVVLPLATVAVPRARVAKGVAGEPMIILSRIISLAPTTAMGTLDAQIVLPVIIL